MRSPIQTRFEDLPEILPVFPLSGALLLPWGRLPLNIFEPRYLNLVLDSLKTGRIFGMIQPDYDKADRSKTTPAKHEAANSNGEETDADAPPVYNVGCAGRVSSFEETEDGRLLITLKGLARYRIQGEVEGMKGYRRMRVSYDEFKTDMEPFGKFDLDRDALLDRLRPYLDAKGVRLNVDAIKGLSETTLVTSLCMICPFDPREKQALLETPSIAERAKTLTTLLQMGAFESGGKPDGPPQ
ncbi:MAG: peptidase S16 [Rhodospirillaceae bacterium]|nr:MAG: peptidase S16 [Rhodospirillaceae bacterium]